jgi:adenylate cyclase
MAPRRTKRSQPERILESARRADSTPELVAAARFLRGLLPGRDDAVRESAGSKRLSQLGRLMSGGEDRPSATREIGAGAMKTWQALSEAQRRRRGTADVAILFTDLVGFSSWALTAGDEAALQLLDEVSDVEKAAVSDNEGIVVKRLGDGAMSVFGDAAGAIAAALEAQHRMAEIKVRGHRPELRAGVHLGQPQKVRGDFLGVDVNIAARVGDAAKGGEVLISDATRDAIDAKRFRFGRKRELVAEGAPEGLSVYPVKPR